MSSLVFVEIDNGEVKKSSLESASYAHHLGEEVIGLVHGHLNDSEVEKLGNAGVRKLLKVDGDIWDVPSPLTLASSTAQAFEQEQCNTLVLSKSSLGDPVAARVAIKINATLISNVTGLPDSDHVKIAIYTGKAFALSSVPDGRKIFAIKKNASNIVETGITPTVVPFQPVINENDNALINKGQEKATGDILLTDADIVISGGRGLKGPENWGIIENLAKALGAATACSKPVSDMDWRPHHEHVGQTGIKVAPNLYIAVGISGAIQHLAGVNSSKFIIVINKDPEAPFFKAADYGIVGDAFDVLPKITEAIKAV